MNKLLWILCIILIIAGISLVIHAMLYYDKAEVVVEWTTASELDTVGFNMLRAETPEGPFEQINSNLIPASSDSLTGGNYTFTDIRVQNGITYYYMLEEIGISGEANRHGPIVVNAENTSILELLIGFSLIAGAIFYIITLIRDRKLAVTAQ